MSTELRKFLKNAKNGDFRAIGYDSRKGESGVVRASSVQARLAVPGRRPPRRSRIHRRASVFPTGRGARRVSTAFRSPETPSQPANVSLTAMALVKSGRSLSQLVAAMFSIPTIRLAMLGMGWSDVAPADLNRFKVI
jgi:hypothetical protein